MSTPSPAPPRLSTGIKTLDACLGGGLIPGTLPVVVGASGIGKTQLGLQFAQPGSDQEGPRGVIFDMSARIDSQSHAEYAQRMFSWALAEQTYARIEPVDFFSAIDRGNYLHVFDQHGRRVTERDMGFDAWH